MLKAKTEVMVVELEDRQGREASLGKIVKPW